MRTILEIMCGGYTASVAWTIDALESLEGAGYRRGGARAAVVELLGRQNCCLSAQEIFDRLRRARRPGGIASGYPALRVLPGLPLAQRVRPRRRNSRCRTPPRGAR